MALQKKYRFLFFFSMLAIGSCMSDAEYTDFRTVAKTGLEEAVVFELNNALDTKKPNNLYLYLRNDNSYAFTNIFLICTLKAGDQLVVQDTLEYALAAPDGTWLGTGFTEVKESKLWWKNGLELPKERPLVIEIQQAMRTNGDPQGVKALEGILSVGIGIEAQE